MGNLKLKNLKKSFDQTHIIKGVDLDIKNGEFVVFVGPSGCGKTTLLRLIAGLEEITSGDCMIDGDRVNEKIPSERGIAMVFQNYALYPHMSVFENIAFSMKIQKKDPEVIKREVQNVADMLQLGHLLERKPKELSGGQRQRVAIGRALVRHPKIFLFDEPLSNLDAELRVKMRVEISQLHKQLNNTMIYVTHDQVEAMTMADKIVILHDGIIEQVGSPETLYTKPANKFVAGFLGCPKMNFIPVIVDAVNEEKIDVLMPDGQKFHVPICSSRIKVGDKLELGLRPEHMHYELKGDLSIKLSVNFSEYLGGQKILHCELGEDMKVTTVVNDSAPDLSNEEAVFYFSSSNIHLFDEDGINVSCN